MRNQRQQPVLHFIEATEACYIGQDQRRADHPLRFVKDRHAAWEEMSQLAIDLQLNDRVVPFQLRRLTALQRSAVKLGQAGLSIGVDRVSGCNVEEASRRLVGQLDAACRIENCHCVRQAVDGDLRAVLGADEPVVIALAIGAKLGRHGIERGCQRPQLIARPHRDLQIEIAGFDLPCRGGQQSQWRENKTPDQQREYDCHGDAGDAQDVHD